MSQPIPAADTLKALIERWSDSQSSERANKDSFLIELCDVLGVERPQPKTGDPSRDVYVFERDVPFVQEEGGKSTGFIDLYKQGYFILEAKQGAHKSTGGGHGKREGATWNAAMNKAFGQAVGYARSLDDPPPFIVVCDVGYCFDLYAQFDGSGAYRPFPNAQRSRLFLKDLAEHVVTLRALFTDPHSLDPSRRATRITREVAGRLAELSKALEAAGHDPEVVARFLMRCIFTMFAEDVHLLPPALFKERIEQEWMKNPAAFPVEVRELWEAMDKGERFGFGGRLLRFNGGLFKHPESLPLTKEQLGMLLDCAKCDWSKVEPSIFGTLLERALSRKERHKLGAHYTPRAYVERLVRPTIEEPLREEWDAIRITAQKALESGQRAELKKARKAVIEFHTKLCNTRVLDPACGTGNFLYVAFDIFKRLEGEVLHLESQLVAEDETLGIEGLQISLKNFLGIEVKPWAQQIAQLVLWIGYLQWHFRTRGSAKPEEPVLRGYDNIQCRDAVLEWDARGPLLGDDGKPVTRWDGVTTKKHPVTGLEVPDESARVPVWKYVNPRPAKWPEAEFIVGNPPFIGKARRRAALGDGYVEALFQAHPDMPEGADFVMWWWHLAAKHATKNVRRFGFITTNSISQALNRPVLERAIKNGVHLRWAVPDHPWADSETGAAVRIAMTVADGAGRAAVLARVDDERPTGDEEVSVVLNEQYVAELHADLSAGASVLSTTALAANRGLATVGVVLFGKGFHVPETAQVEEGATRRIINGRSLIAGAESKQVIDLYPLELSQARQRFPRATQWLLGNVKPDRDLIRDPGSRKSWWRFGRDKPELRRALAGFRRYVATVEVSKVGAFMMVDGGALPDHTLIAIAIDDAWVLGCLSSRLHRVWALRTGSRMGVGNDSRYNKSKCFDPFPFPAATDAQKARIRALGEELDAHRKRQQAQHPGLTITGMYNVLEKLHAGEPLNAKEKVIHEQGLVSVLKDVHDRLDAAVFDAYGWPTDLTDEQIIERLVALNAERAAEEKRGLVRWLRPEFQNPQGVAKPEQTELDTDESDEAPVATVAGKAAWPKTLPERMAVVRDEVAAQSVVSAGALAKALGAKKADEVREVLEGFVFLGQMRATGEGKERMYALAGRR